MTEKLAVLRKKSWTKYDLRKDGFKYYHRQKMVVLARVLKAEEAPLTIVTPYDTLVADEGYMICFRGSREAEEKLFDYEHWPISPDIFNESYEQFEEEWEPNESEKHMISLGCTPYYRTTGVWAKRLEEDVRYQSMESKEPVTAPEGCWLLIGGRGEPYSTIDEDFRSRYIIE